MNSDRATGIRITAARYGISEAGTVSPSVGVNGQARRVALTPLSPSPAFGQGGICRGDGLVAYTAVRPYTPLPPRGRGAGGEG